MMGKNIDFITALLIIGNTVNIIEIFVSKKYFIFKIR